MRRTLPLVSAVLALSGCPKGGGGDNLQSQLESEVIALTQRLKELEANEGQCLDTGPADSLYAKAHQLFAKTEVTVGHKGRITIISMPADYLFSQGTLTMRAEAKMSLDLLATALKGVPEATIVVEGHTDDSTVPSPLNRAFPTNWDYSLARAGAVMQSLMTFGVPERRFAVMGRGEQNPVADNDTESGKAQNRRVVVYVYPPGVLP